MVNTDLAIPIVVAAIGLLGSLLGIYMSYRSQKEIDLEMRGYEAKLNETLETHKGEVTKKIDENKIQLDHEQTVSILTDKYSQPLLVAAYDLQQRLYELLEFPISRQHLTKPDGLQDIKIFTCFLLAQYLAYTYILRTKLGYLSFVKDERLIRLRKMLYIIDEELDRRRQRRDGHNVGVWPAARILVCERMLLKTETGRDAALDGGFGVEVKGLNTFLEEWPSKFRQPMGYFCEWIDLMLDGRMKSLGHNEAAMRCLQHLLVDLLRELDKHGAYIPDFIDINKLKCKRSSVDCDCDGKDCKEDRKEKNLDEVLRTRQYSRLGDHGIWSKNGLREDMRDDNHRTPNNAFSLAKVIEMTLPVDLT
jgi:hypothetical protein